MYYVHKIVGWCFSPFGLFFVSLAVAWALRRFGRGWMRRLGMALAVAATAALWIFSCGISAGWIGVPLEGDEVDVATLPKADAIVLLGGGMALHEKCGRPEICSGADRVWTAAKLWKAGKSRTVTVSGGAARAEIEFLADMGVATNDLVVLDAARNTEEEARMIRAALAAKRISSAPKILLVTSAWHMPRARMLFERAGFDVIPAPTDYEFSGMAEAELGVGDFFPGPQALERNSYAVKEWVARFFYWVKGLILK